MLFLEYIRFVHLPVKTLKNKLWTNEIPLKYWDFLVLITTRTSYKKPLRKFINKKLIIIRLDQQSKILTGDFTAFVPLKHEKSADFELLISDFLELETCSTFYRI